MTIRIKNPGQGWLVEFDGATDCARTMELRNAGMIEALDAIDSGQEPCPVALGSLEEAFPGAIFVDSTGKELGALSSDDDDDDESSICGDCSGSGEGSYDGSSCRTCKGSGEYSDPPEDWEPEYPEWDDHLDR
jgi:hypothetical protein